MSESAVISLVAETSIHPGVGRSTGALDLPVARERTTHYPFVPGSGVKGAFRVWAGDRAGIDEAQVKKLFGPKGTSAEDSGSALHAGALLLSDARLLLLPVRCLSDAFKWVTCPAILQRFKRDCDRAGLKPGSFTLPVFKSGDTGFYGHSGNGSHLGLEEREFSRKGDIDDDVRKAVKAVVATDLAGFVDERLVVLSDTDFTWFARYALPVMARNVLDDNKISINLWYEETLAPDTVMYAVLANRTKKNGEATAVSRVVAAIGDEGPGSYIQIGGNETIGQGWFKMRTLGADG